MQFSVITLLVMSKNFIKIDHLSEDLQESPGPGLFGTESPCPGLLEQRVLVQVFWNREFWSRSFGARSPGPGLWNSESWSRSFGTENPCPGLLEQRVLVQVFGTVSQVFSNRES